MSRHSSYDIGVDTGGTFTDVVARDGAGRLHVHKLLSTPDDPSRAIADGARAVSPGASRSLVHGTTVATNALLERKGARVAFVTTAGFEDLLVLRRQNRPELYALVPQLPEPLVARADCVGVVERTTHRGDVLVALSDSEVARVVDRVEALSPDAVAICLLHCYANPGHEVRVARALREAFPALHVTASHELVREFREYERASTTAVNAFVGPVMSRYLRALSERLAGTSVEILQSSGGRIGADEAARAPVHTVLSGPAGGVLGALAAAREAGFERIITFDMGGTSTDVSLCDGEPTLTWESSLDDMPLRVPVLDIVTVGAGGGSIARRDLGGALRVGPESAGASPGPACYGQGGVAPTVTDAHLALGRLRADRFLGGAMQLDAERARDAVADLGAQIGLDPDATAAGILDVADAAMVRAIKVVSVHRGRDPREYALVSFGGAGGLHACRLADALGIRTVLVPRHPGLRSAYGMLHAERQRLFSQTVLRELDPRCVEEVAEVLRTEADAVFGRDGREDRVVVDLRYRGQSFEIPIEAAPEQLVEQFHARHEELFGYRDDERAIELVAVRLRAAFPGDVHIVDEQEELAESAREQALVGFGGPRVDAVVVERQSLAADEVLEGPAVITEYSGTTVVDPGWRVRRVRGHLVLERS